MSAELIARLEAATGDDDALDDINARVWWLVDRPRASVTYWNGATGLPRELTEYPERGLGNLALLGHAPDYCRSIDAALTLVPEGCWWSASQFAGALGSRKEGYQAHVLFADRPHVWGYGNTAAMALCIAALKARAPSTKAGER